MGKFDFVVWMQGKKVDILAALAGLAGIVSFIAQGDFSIAALFALGKTEWAVALIAAIRAAISKSAPAPVK
jgi:hypothetical protein